jgi:3-oxoacyl-[acyl-carrier protein] reductase
MSMLDTPGASAPIAIVTGGARGIGAEIARRLASDGHDIAIFDLEPDAADGPGKAIRCLGRQFLPIAVDVTDPRSVSEAVVRTADELGAPAVLVNNAGLLREATLRNATLADWELVQDVNLRSAFIMAQAVVPHMRTAGHGRIVNLTSTGALGAFGLSAYAAAKAGLHGLTKALAVELGRYGITVNAVAPGLTLTPMIEEMSARAGVPVEKLMADALRDIPVGRLGQAADIAHAVAFFADPRSDFVSGQILYVTGGPRT